MTPRWMRWVSLSFGLRLCGYGIGLHLGLHDYDRMYGLRIDVWRWYAEFAIDGRRRESRMTPRLFFGRSYW